MRAPAGRRVYLVAARRPRPDAAARQGATGMGHEKPSRAIGPGAWRRVACRAAAALVVASGPAPAAAADAADCTGPACPAAPADARDARDAPCRIGDPSGAQPHRQFDAGCLARRTFAGPVPRDRCPPGTPPCAASDAAAAPGNEAGAPVTLPPVDVFGSREPADERPPTLEERFASALDRGNPIVASGKVRHGAYHALGMYWGRDPLEFLYLNLRYGLFDRD